MRTIVTVCVGLALTECARKFSRPPAFSLPGRPAQWGRSSLHQTSAPQVAIALNTRVGEA